MKNLLTFIFALALCWPAFGQTKSIVTPLATTSADNGLLRYDGTTGQLVQAATGMTYSDNRALTIGGATITASEPILDLSQTWNNAAVTFTGLKYNVTATANAAASLIMDLQLGSASKLSLRQDGALYLYGGTTGSQTVPELVFGSRGTNWGFFTGSSSVSLTVAGNERLKVWNDGYVSIDTALQIGTTDLVQDSAAVLQMGSDAATATAQKLKAHDGSGTDKAGADMTIAAGIGTGTASGGSLYLQTGGVGGASGSSLNTLTNRVAISPTGQMLFQASGGQSTPNISIASSTNSGFYFSANNPAVTVGGSIKAQWDSTYFYSYSPISLGGSDAYIGREGTGIVQIGIDAAAPVAQTFKAADGSGTDIAGSSLTIAGGKSTGTGAGGALITQTSLSGSTGSSANSYSTRTYQNAKPVTLTESAATTIATIAVGSSKYVGAKLFVTVNAGDATDFQALSSTLNVNAVNKAGTVTPTITQVDGTTAASAGTLTATYTVTTSGANVIIQCNSVSSLTQTTLNAKWSIETLNSDDTAAVTVP